MKTLLAFDDVGYTYADGTVALSGVSISLAPGRRTVLLGRNGSGKSTLMQLCNGLLAPTSGRILFEDKPVDRSRSGLKQLRARVGFIFQETDCQLFSASVEQDVSFGPFNLGWSEDRVRAATAETLKQTACEAFQHKPTHYLSGGQKKRAAVAGVVVMEPRLILADEPTAHLDPEGCDQLLDLFSELHASGITFVVATHDLGFARAWFDDAVILSAGKVIASGPVETILNNEPLMREAGLVSRYARGGWSPL